MGILASLGKWRWLAVPPLAVIALGGLVAFYLYLVQDQERWDRKFGVVRDGVLLRGCQPDAERLGVLQRDHGVKTIISLVNWNDIEERPDCAIEQELAHKHGMRFVHMPISVPRPEEIRQMYRLTAKVNAILKSFLERRGLVLVDFKLEFGRNEKGELILGDEISPDTCRFWDRKTHKKLDKDRFRFDMGGIDKAYQEILERISNA